MGKKLTAANREIVLIHQLNELRRRKPVQYMIDEKFHIIPVKEVCDHPLLLTQRIFINRLTNQPLMIYQSTSLYDTVEQAQRALRLLFEKELKQLRKFRGKRQKVG